MILVVQYSYTPPGFVRTMLLMDLCCFLCCFQSAQNLAQISDLQAQLEEALKEKQEVQEKVTATFLLFTHTAGCFTAKPG